MYKQTTNSIKLVIIPIDGALFNLNKLRYNYCKNFADSRNLEISKLDFYKRLSNNYDMYENLSISTEINVSSFSAQIENDLKSYFEYHTLETKPGAQALMEGLKNKGIQIAVISTHREEDARFYLNKSGLIKYCDLVLGVDNGFRPLPANDTLKAIQAKFGVLSQDILVVSPFTSLNKAAESLAFNIVYIKDFVNPTQYDIASSYKCVTDLYEVLNVVLFDRYDDASLYASVLGFNARMNRAQLSDRYNHLLSVYGDDAEIIAVVERTYKEYCSRLNDGIQYVDYPSMANTMTDIQREDITQQVQKSILNDQNEVNELFKEETVEMMVRKMANEPVQEEQTVQKNKKEEDNPEVVEDSQDKLEITNSQLVSQLFKETANNNPTQKTEVNKDVKLTIDKLRASLDEEVISRTGELLNPQVLESVTEEHSTPTFRIVSDQKKSDTIVIEPETVKEIKTEVEKDHKVSEKTIVIDPKANLEVEKKTQTIIEDNNDTFDQYDDTYKPSKHQNSYGMMDWFIDVIFVLLINLLICVLAAILYIVFIQRGVITNEVVLKAVSYINMYIQLVVTYVGKYLSSLIVDAFVLALVSVYLVNSLILILFTTIIKLIFKR